MIDAESDLRGGTNITGIADSSGYIPCRSTLDCPTPKGSVPTELALESLSIKSSMLDRAF